MTTTPPDRLPPGEDETGGMPPPDVGGLPPEVTAYFDMLDNRPSFAPPGYEGAPAYALYINSVGRRQGRVQASGCRSPFEFEHAHGIFFQVRFELLPIPDHAMGVAYLNYADRTWMFGRRAGNYHVEYRSASPPYTMHPPQRLGMFCTEAMARVGTRKFNKSRWYYFCWDRGRHGEHGDVLF